MWGNIYFTVVIEQKYREIFQQEHVLVTAVKKRWDFPLHQRYEGNNLVGNNTGWYFKAVESET